MTVIVHADRSAILIARTDCCCEMTVMAPADRFFLRSRMNSLPREVIWMRTQQWQLYLEAFLSVLCIFSGLYLLRDVISNSSRDTSSSLLVGSVLVTVGVTFALWFGRTYVILKSRERTARASGYRGSRGRKNFGHHHP